MKFTLMISGAPYSSEAPQSALRFAKAALENNHEICRVFLHGDGVLLATRLATPAQDEIDIHQAWDDLATQHKIDVVVCIASALKRGILNEKESIRYNKRHYNLATSMDLAGLGQLIDGIYQSDRIITFGS